jgi:Putative prokaryotic signal transducing protein
MNEGMELVRLTIVPNEIEAEQIRSLLGFEGIESIQRLTDFGSGSIDAGTSGVGAREILVKPEDLEAARAIVEGG